MSNEVRLFSAEDVAALLNERDSLKRARIYDRESNRPADFQIVTLTLTYGTAKLESDPYKINFPFRTAYVLKTSHPALVVKMKPITNDSQQGAIELVGKDVIDFGSPINRAFLFWDAQSVSGSSSIAQTVTILFSMEAEFKSGSFTSPLKGIKTDVYDTFTCGPTTVSAATATLLTSPIPTAVQDNCWLIQWQGTDDLYLGDSNVDGAGGTYIGIKIEPGESFRWNNKQPLYGFSTLGGTAVVLREF